MFRNLSITNKLMIIIMLTSTVVLLLTAAAFFSFEYYTFFQTSMEQLEAIADVTAYNSSVAVAYLVTEDAFEVLAALKTERHITQAAIYDIRGELFAYYPPDEPLSSFPDTIRQEGSYLLDNHIEVYKPIVEENKHHGTLFLKSDLTALYERIYSYSGIVTAILLGSFLIALLISYMLQGAISTPILSLADTARIISLNRDYSVRVEKTSTDELGVLTDAFNQMLSQIQHQELALRESIRRFQELADSMLQIVWTTDRNGKIDYFNHRWFEYSGRKEEEALDQAWLEVIHSEDRERTIAEWSKANQSGRNFIIEHRLKRNMDQTYRWHLTRALPIRNEEGQVIRWFGTSTDIEDQKRVQEILRENQERLNLALSASKVGIWSWDIQKNTVQLDENSHYLFNIEPGSFSGNPEDLFQMIDPVDVERVRKRMYQAIEEGQEYEIEFRLIGSDRSIHYLFTRGKVYTGFLGIPQRLIGFCMDITERKKSEELLEMHARELAR